MVGHTGVPGTEATDVPNEGGVVCREQGAQTHAGLVHGHYQLPKLADRAGEGLLREYFNIVTKDDKKCQDPAGDPVVEGALKRMAGEGS